MTRLIARCTAAVMACLAGAAAPAAAQLDSRPQPRIPVAQRCATGCEPHAASHPAASSQTDLHGIVNDEAGQPLSGVVVSALGVTTAFAISNGEGRFALRNLPYGPYLVRAHLEGYLPAPARIVQVTREARSLTAIALTRRLDGKAPTPVLAAGLGPAGGDVETAGADGDGHDHGEAAWRLRHLKRGILKDAAAGVDVDDAAPVRSQPAAFAMVANLPLSGQVNLLTTTSFDRPQDLFSSDTWLPHGIALVSLQAPTAGGEWAIRGAITQRDLASWTVAGSYVSRAGGRHRYHTGLSYSMQRYLSGNADALAAVADRARDAGAVHAYDEWSIGAGISVSYGAKYARYDYLPDPGLLSPRASITITPAADSHLTVRASVSRHSVAPGAEEFNAPSTGLWLPPERTFSPLSAPRGFSAESVGHVEIAAEREWVGAVVVGVRAFRQRVDNQLVTLFGTAQSGATATLGHYYVASGGDLEARGWGVSLSRAVSDGFRASIDYTQADSEWLRHSPDAAALSLVALSALRSGDERIHDVTTSIESVLPATDTRVFVLYKINTGFADATVPAPHAATRFDVQLHQSLPFLNFTSTEWEMLVAVRNLFRDELLDASVYDELLVVRPPKRIVGGVTVRF